MRGDNLACFSCSHYLCTSNTNVSAVCVCVSMQRICSVCACSSASVCMYMWVGGYVHVCCHYAYAHMFTCTLCMHAWQLIYHAYDYINKDNKFILCSGRNDSFSPTPSLAHSPSYIHTMHTPWNAHCNEYVAFHLHSYTKISYSHPPHMYQLIPYSIW